MIESGEKSVIVTIGEEQQQDDSRKECLSTKLERPVSSASVAVTGAVTKGATVLGWLRMPLTCRWESVVPDFAESLPAVRGSRLDEPLDQFTGTRSAVLSHVTGTLETGLPLESVKVEVTNEDTAPAERPDSRWRG